MKTEIFAETERLYLRKILPSDRTGMFELDSDPAVHRYLGNKPVKTMQEAEQVIAAIRTQYAHHGIARWAVIEKETNCFVGWCGLKYITETVNKHTQFYDIGYRFLRRFWGKGYATESARAALDYGFNRLQLKEISAIADADNLSSRKVLEKIGLRYVETFEYHGIPHHWFKIEALAT